jgi:hypothetical protein
MNKNNKLKIGELYREVFKELVGVRNEKGIHWRGGATGDIEKW